MEGVIVYENEGLEEKGAKQTSTRITRRNILGLMAILGRYDIEIHTTRFHERTQRFQAGIGIYSLHIGHAFQTTASKTSVDRNELEVFEKQGRPREGARSTAGIVKEEGHKNFTK